MIRELRELSLTVYRCRGAIEMPEVIRARDQLIQRFVTAAISTMDAEASSTRDVEASTERDVSSAWGDEEIPLYVDPDEPLVRSPWARRVH